MKKNEIRSVKDKLLSLPLSSLTSRELSVYLMYRLENLLRRRLVLSKMEFEYLLCETGNGRLRFDPDIVDRLINYNEPVNGSISSRAAGQDTSLYYSLVPEEDVLPIAEAKGKLVSAIKSSQSAAQAQLSDLVESIIISAGNTVKSLSSDADRIEVVLNNKPFLIWFYPNRWIYPHSTELWQLIRKAYELDLNPILLSRKIHGVCFTLFKALGLFGANTYSLYLPEEVMDQIHAFEETEWFGDIKFTPGNISVLPFDTNLSNFFTNVLPKHEPMKKIAIPLNKFELLTSAEYGQLERLDALHKLARYLPDKRIKGHVSNWANYRTGLLRDLLNEEN